MTTFEDVNQHVENLGALPPIAPGQLCVYYKAAKPILTLMETFPFFPAKWKTVLSGLTTLLDALCP
jgi:hypothetical protein